MKAWHSPSGTLTLAPERGRMLQAEVGGHAAFWVNPTPDDGWNIGGDRLWLAPENDWNWKTRGPFDFCRYEVPRAMDPGTWQIMRESEGYCAVEMMVKLQHQHADSEVELRLSRSFYQVAPPEGAGEAIAYQTDAAIEIVGGTPGQLVGLWQLVQLIAGGELSVATRPAPRFRDYFAPIPPSHWTEGESELRFRITGDQQYKVGIPACCTSGELTYDRPVKDGVLRLQRHFFPQPWRDYADHPLLQEDTPGDAVQIYNDGGQFGGFGEMEYHSPALCVGTGPQRLQDSSLTVLRLIPTPSS